MYNLQLSQNRAFAVVSYCLDENNHFLSDSQLEELRVLLTANGRSWSAPVYAADGTVDMQASRRVEIKFRLKDEEMMNQIAEMLEETKGKQAISLLNFRLLLRRYERNILQVLKSKIISLILAS